MHPRGVAELLRLNNLLTLYERILNTHKSNLEKIQKDLFDRTFQLYKKRRKPLNRYLVKRSNVQRVGDSEGLKQGKFRLMLHQKKN